MEMNQKTTGTIAAVKKLWWLKINTKPVRLHSLDGAIFPHRVTVRYTVNGAEYIKKKIVSAWLVPPPVGTEIALHYNEDKPKKCRIDTDDWEELIV